MQEMDLCEYQLLYADNTELTSELTSALEHILFHQEQIKDKIGRQLVSYQNTLDEMGDFLTSWLLSHESPT
ncbi:MAG: hypothetical protein LUE63_10705 [Lachnospiraceae bacterium]|nr:hypothetical protein [Lachnospiraceae bacterium]